jgi:hypothetical protein
VGLPPTLKLRRTRRSPEEGGKLEDRSRSEGQPHVQRVCSVTAFRAAGSRRRVPLATPEECASGSRPQRAVSGPDSARRCIPRLSPETGVLKGRAGESPSRVRVTCGGGASPGLFTSRQAATTSPFMNSPGAAPPGHPDPLCRSAPREIQPSCPPVQISR